MNSSQYFLCCFGNVLPPEGDNMQKDNYHHHDYIHLFQKGGVEVKGHKNVCVTD